MKHVTNLNMSYWHLLKLFALKLIFWQLSFTVISTLYGCLQALCMNKLSYDTLGLDTRNLLPKLKVIFMAEERLLRPEINMVDLISDASNCTLS